MNEEETTAEELRELIRRGHELVRDLAALEKRLPKVIAEFEGKVTEVAETPKAEIVKELGAFIEGSKTQIVDDVIATTEDMQNFVRNEVYKRFDILMDILLGHDRGNRDQSIPDLINSRLNLSPERQAMLEGILAPLSEKS